MTAFDLLASVAEMGGVVGSKVENIYRTEVGFLFKLSSAYLVATRHRVSLTGVIPEKSHEGAETLRGLFRDERLTAVSMPRFDRIVELAFSSGRLVAELLEPFNVIAVREGKVVWLLHSYRGKDREVRSGLPYAYPPAVFIDVLTADVDAIEKAIDPSDVRRSLIRRLGTGPELADELIARVGASPRALAEMLKTLIDQIRAGRLEPAVCIKGGAPVTVMPIRPVSMQCDEVKLFNSFWAALDYYFTPMELAAMAVQKTQELAARRKKLEATVAELEKKIPEYREEAARLKSLAHKLLMYKNEIEEALRGGESSIRILHVDRSKVKIELPEGDVVEVSRDTSLGRYITKLFDEAKELEEKASRAVQVLERLKKELAEVEEKQRRSEEEVKTSVKAVARRSWFERFHWTLTTGRKPVIGGRDASQNETIVRKYLKDHYLFFHADIPGASAVEVNISSPTYRGLWRDLPRLGDVDLPIFIKIGPGTNMPLVIKAARRMGWGLVVTNTFPVEDRRISVGRGGLSGLLVYKYGVRMLRRIRGLVGPDTPIIYSGGLFTCSQLREVLKLANAAEALTSILYFTPFVLKLLNQCPDIV